jgi:hypothetical protein
MGRRRANERQDNQPDRHLDGRGVVLDLERDAVE